MSPVRAIVDEAKPEHFGKGGEVSDEVVRGDVDIVVEVGDGAVPHVPRDQDNLDGKYHQSGGWFK